MSVRKADDFIADVERQYRWYLQNANEDVAESYLTAVETTCRLLGQHPQLGPRGGFDHPRLRDWRFFVVCAALRLAALPENVNYAVKSSFLLSFLESVPEVSAKLEKMAALSRGAATERKFEDVVKSAEQAAVLVLVY